MVDVGNLYANFRWYYVSFTMLDVGNSVQNKIDPTTVIGDNGYSLPN